MAKRADGDVESEAVVRKAELVEKITAAGKFSKDYSSLISANAYNILSTLLPGLALEAASSNAAGGAVAGGGAAAAAAVAASFSTAVDIGGTDAAYSADVGPTMEVQHEFPINPFRDSHIFPDDNVVLMGTAYVPHQNAGGDFFSYYGGGFNQAAAESMWGASNDTWRNPHNSYTGVDGGVYQWGPASAAAKV